MFFALSAFAVAAAQPIVEGQPDQAFFAIFAETKVGRMAGVEVFDFRDIPPGIKLPPEAMMFAGIPTRTLNMRLWSPSIAPKDATASVAPPAGLKQGPKLDLELYRPKEGEVRGEDVESFNPEATPDFTIKIYWGSSATVKDGQPKVFKWDGLSAEQQNAMRQRARESSASSSYFYRPGWTTGYWPTQKQPGNIGADASLVGKFSLSTNYTGSVAIEVPSSVTFLAPFELSSPNLEKKIDLKKAMQFKWKAIPNVLGQHAFIFSMEGKNTVTLWVSSEEFNDAVMGDMGFLQMAEVRDYVSKSMFMAPERTEVTVPLGIFANADVVMMSMVGYGPGVALETAQPLPRLQTKTTLTAMLGGKMMKDIGIAPSR